MACLTATPEDAGTTARCSPNTHARPSSTLPVSAAEHARPTSSARLTRPPLRGVAARSPLSAVPAPAVCGPAVYGPAANAPAPTVSDITVSEITIGDEPSDVAFATLRALFQASGGIARGDDLAHRLEALESGGFVGLARRIVAGEVLAIEWQRLVWVPMFQFDLTDLSYRLGPRLVLAELTPRLDAWRVARWFAMPHARLAQRRPVDELHARLPQVLDAARSDHFVANG